MYFGSDEYFRYIELKATFLMVYFKKTPYDKKKPS